MRTENMAGIMHCVAADPTGRLRTGKNGGKYANAGFGEDGNR
jgi:hypothetical protein